MTFILASLIVFGAWIGWLALADKMWQEDTRVWLASQSLALHDLHRQP